MRDDTCLKDVWSLKLEQSVYSSRGTGIIGVGHCLGVGNEGEKGVKCNLIFSATELILMLFMERVAYTPWSQGSNFGREKITGHIEFAILMRNLIGTIY